MRDEKISILHRPAYFAFSREGKRTFCCSRNEFDAASSSSSSNTCTSTPDHLMLLEGLEGYRLHPGHIVEMDGGVVVPGHGRAAGGAGGTCWTSLLNTEGDGRRRYHVYALPQSNASELLSTSMLVGSLFLLSRTARHVTAIMIARLTTTYTLSRSVSVVRNPHQLSDPLYSDLGFITSLLKSGRSRIQIGELYKYGLVAMRIRFRYIFDNNR